eukprot:12266350-Alexandrium_andersonii.AAC.1
MTAGRHPDAPLPSASGLLHRPGSGKLSGCCAGPWCCADPWPLLSAAYGAPLVGSSASPPVSGCRSAQGVGAHLHRRLGKAGGR